MKSLRNQNGLSLIEIMIVMAIIGGMMALGATMLFPGNDEKLREEAVRMAGTIKYLYNEAAVKNKYFRIVFNLDEESYSVESSTEPFLVTLEDEEPKAKSEFDSALKPATPLPSEAEAPEGSPAAQGFTAEDAFLAKPVRFSEGIKFKNVFVMHAKVPQESGQVYAYFFPNGWVEPMIVNLSDDEEETFYSLEVNPLTGKAKIRNELLEGKEGSLRPETPL